MKEILNTSLTHIAMGDLRKDDGEGNGYNGPAASPTQPIPYNPTFTPSVPLNAPNPPITPGEAPPQLICTSGGTRENTCTLEIQTPKLLMWGT